MNEHIPKYVLKLLKGTINNKTKGVIKVKKRPSTTEHLINNVDCTNNNNFLRFKLINNC